MSRVCAGTTSNRHGAIHFDFDDGCLVCMGRTEIEKLQSENAALREENEKLKHLLWLRHGCDGLYGDDGERQCNRCQIDFNRDSVERIVTRFQEIYLEKLRKSGHE